MEAPGLSNDRFWTPTVIVSVFEVTAISENAKKTSSSSQLASAHFTGKPKHSKQATTIKLRKADELAHHSHHHTALSLRVGAGGGVRSP